MPGFQVHERKQPFPLPLASEQFLQLAKHIPCNGTKQSAAKCRRSRDHSEEERQSALAQTCQPLGKIYQPLRHPLPPEQPTSEPLRSLSLQAHSNPKNLRHQEGRSTGCSGAGGAWVPWNSSEAVP